MTARDELRRLLRESNEHPEDLPAIDPDEISVSNLALTCYRLS